MQATDLGEHDPRRREERSSHQILIPAPEGGGPRAATSRAKTSTNDHAAAAARARRAMIGRGIRIGGVIRCLRLDLRHWGGHQRLGAHDVGLAAGAGEQPVVADAMKPLWQNVAQEARRSGSIEAQRPNSSLLTPRWRGQSPANSSRESGGTPHFGILFPLMRAPGQRREPRHGRPICRRQTRLRGEIPEPSGGFNVKTGLARVPPGSNAAVLLVFSTVASTILRCGGSLGPR